MQTTKVHVRPLTHEIRIRNQVIYLDPPIELARQDWIGQLQDTLGECCRPSRSPLLIKTGVICASEPHQKLQI